MSNLGRIYVKWRQIDGVTFVPGESSPEPVDHDRICIEILSCGHVGGVHDINPQNFDVIRAGKPIPQFRGQRTCTWCEWHRKHFGTRDAA
jgi:hypothetical protein